MMNVGLQEHGHAGLVAQRVPCTPHGLLSRVTYSCCRSGVQAAWSALPAHLELDVGVVAAVQQRRQLVAQRRVRHLNQKVAPVSILQLGAMVLCTHNL